MAETEAVLLKRFAGSRDAQAFAEIIRRHAGVVYGASLRILADVDRASDIAQETFLQLTKDAGNVTGSLPGWLYQVATHKAINQKRREAARRRREQQYVATERQPTEPTEWKDISPHVDVALRELDPELREVLILHFLEGRTTREIAAEHSVSQATVSRRIGCGVEQLRTMRQRRGIIVATGVLSTLLGENAAQAVPLSLLAGLEKMAVVAEVAGAASSLTTAVGGVVATVKSHAVAVAAVALLGAGAVVTCQQAVRSSSRQPLAVPARSTMPSVPRRVVHSSPAPQYPPAPVAEPSAGAQNRDATGDIAARETTGLGRAASPPEGWGSQPKVARAAGRRAEPQAQPPGVMDGTVRAAEPQKGPAGDEMQPRVAGVFVARAGVRPSDPPNDPNGPQAPGGP
jgi:RNA polymerase sigma factor (sigma-70 family)